VLCDLNACPALQKVRERRCGMVVTGNHCLQMCGDFGAKSSMSVMLRSCSLAWPLSTCRMLREGTK
jgi:hypothetical protein